MTVQEFKDQLKKIGFEPDRTAECDDMMVNLKFLYPVDKYGTKWTSLRCAVLFYPDQHFAIQIATLNNKRFTWGTWNQTLHNAPSASQVLAYAIGELNYKYRINFPTI